MRTYGAPLSSPVRAVVACVDDEPAILRSYRRLLRHEPYELLMFHDPKDALKWIDRSDVDLILTDERMPGMTGTELLEEVNRRSPGTSCALITAYPEPEVVTRRTGFRIDRLIAKPWKDEELKGALRRLLNPRDAVEDRWIREGLLRVDSGKRTGLEARIDATGMTSAAILEQVVPLCIWSQASHESPLLILENLRRLADPLTLFFQDLVRIVERIDARLSIREESGLIATFLAAAAQQRGTYGQEGSSRTSGR